MTFEERCDLILAFARALYVNGQSPTRLWPQPNSSARLSVCAPNRAALELQLQAETGDAKQIAAVSADPTGVNMDRVAVIFGVQPLTPAVLDIRERGGRCDPAPRLGAV